MKIIKLSYRPHWTNAEVKRKAACHRVGRWAYKIRYLRAGADDEHSRRHPLLGESFPELWETGAFSFRSRFGVHIERIRVILEGKRRVSCFDKYATTTIERKS